MCSVAPHSRELAPPALAPPRSQEEGREWRQLHDHELPGASQVTAQPGIPWTREAAAKRGLPGSRPLLYRSLSRARPPGPAGRAPPAAAPAAGQAPLGAGEGTGGGPGGSARAERREPRDTRAPSPGSPSCGGSPPPRCAARGPASPWSSPAMAAPEDAAVPGLWLRPPGSGGDAAPAACASAPPGPGGRARPSAPPSAPPRPDRKSVV